MFSLWWLEGHSLPRKIVQHCLLCLDPSSSCHSWLTWGWGQMVLVLSLGTETGFKFSFFHILALWSGTRYLISPYPCSIFKTGIIIGLFRALNELLCLLEKFLASSKLYLSANYYYTLPSSIKMPFPQRHLSETPP